ncbi:polysaccharide deacetylase family protein, partial [Micrococcus sp. SIMBA_144]
MTQEQTNELQSKGHEIASHTHDHLMFSALTPDEIEYQCKQSKELLTGMGFRVENLIYPGGNLGGDAGLERIKKYYKSGYHSGSGTNANQYKVIK